MKFEFDNVIRVAREQGFLGFIRKCFLYIGFPLRLYAFRRSPGEKTPRELVEFSFTVSSGLIKPLQVKSEITGLIERLEDSPPCVILEIGTAVGGSLFLFLGIADRNARVVSLDLPGGIHGGGYPLWRVLIYKMFPSGKQQLHLVRDDSHSAEGLEQVKSRLGGEAIDFLLIDGDHTYEGVRQDFETFAPLVKPGGLIAFHDILPHANYPECGVDQLWNEVKEGFEHEEIIEDSAQGWAGIGLLKWAGEASE